MIDNIDIDLDDVDEYLNDYDDDKIDDELVDYIMDSIVDLDNNIVFKVNFNYDGNKDKANKFKERIDNTFKDLNVENDIAIKKTNYRIISMFLLGVLLLWVSNLLMDFDFTTFSEVTKILCWFSISYVGEEVIFARRKLIKIKKKYDKVFNAKIFINNKKR